MCTVNELEISELESSEQCECAQNSRLQQKRDNSSACSVSTPRSTFVGLCGSHLLPMPPNLRSRTCGHIYIVDFISKQHLRLKHHSNLKDLGEQNADHPRRNRPLQVPRACLPEQNRQERHVQTQMLISAEQ